jgi:hypothetical protein
MAAKEKSEEEDSDIEVSFPYRLHIIQSSDSFKITTSNCAPQAETATKWVENTAMDVNKIHLHDNPGTALPSAKVN